MQAPGTTELFNFPTLRSGVEIEDSEDGIALIYGNQSCDISTSGDAKQSMRALVNALKDGNSSIDDLRVRHQSLATSIDPLLEELDRLGLVTESKFEWPLDARSGQEFNSHIRDLAIRATRTRCKSRLFSMMKDGSLTREMLIGYALEYYYLVREALGLIAPALSQADSRRNRQAVQRFLVSELDHDLMLADCLNAAGIDISQGKLDYLIPLPSTFALCVALGVYAKQHLLSFKSILFLFEIPSIRFNDMLSTYCSKVGLPDGFSAPLFNHANINDSLDHEDVTADLLNDLTAISREEQLVVEKNVVLTVETMAQQEEEIINYYGQPNAVIPRIFQ
ncbi:hypothetical protein [Paraburkholderia silvatlantica]|uniref:Heme oxygenase-like protein n=1 Tax=Paraburkholderia silvatlantica TaxID=321895 RepID=A0A2V4UKL4_9BURK|nr:hypothetical protein [Paraburkholderia silvatlantica]PYE21306.1 hypothetical protein C7410_115149 [Paraburkholderia silvatlantica]TDQ86553.1 hypothetical protein C7412_11748 [Paraburkholderia silvatlantica]